MMAGRVVARRTRIAGFFCLTVAVPLCLGLAVFLPGCHGANGSPAELHRLCPTLPDEIIQYLTAGSDSAFCRYARRVGTRAIRNIRGKLDEALIFGGPVSEYPVRQAGLAPACLRTGRVLAGEFGCDEYLRDFQCRFGKRMAVQTRFVEITREEAALLRDNRLSLAEQEQWLLKARDEMQRLGFPHDTHLIEEKLSKVGGRLGDDAKEKAWLKTAVRHARENRDYYMFCQYSGDLGVQEDNPLGRIVLKEALDIANRYHFVDQVVRLMKNLAITYGDEGNLTIAHQLTIECEEICRRGQADTYELNFVIDMARRYANWGAWEVSRHFSERARVLLDLYGTQETATNWKIMRTGVEILKLRELLTSGQMDEAERLAAEIEPAVEQRDDQYHEFLKYRAEAYLRTGRPDRALPLLRRALQRARDHHIAMYVPTLLQSEAEALFSMGKPRSAEASLAEFESLPSGAIDPALEIRHEALKLRLRPGNAARGDALRLFDEVYGRVRNAVRRLDAGTPSYVFIERAAPFREAAHEFFGTSPRGGYAFELSWRSLYADLGAASRDSLARAESSGNPPRASVAGAAEIARKRFRPPSVPEATPPVLGAHTIHLLYAFDGDRTLRWTASNRGVWLDSLPVSRQEIESAVELLAAGNTDHVPDPARAACLTRLAKRLLPDSVRYGTSAAATLLITVDGALNHIPFEILNAGTESSYTPLLARWNVAYYRGSRPARAEACSRPSLVVTNPTPTPRLLRRFPNLEHLYSSLSEAESARQSFHPARLLQGDDATLAAFSEAATGAPVVYAATHMIHDPEIPFMSYLPLFDPPDNPSGDQSVLDISAVRQLDLASCRMVVLSGCRSGVSSASDAAIGPPFGEAFLDAGAASVIQTFWQVEDNEALKLMTDFMARLGAGGDPVVALNEARRAAWRASRIGTSTRDSGWPAWANYHISLNRYPAIPIRETRPAFSSGNIPPRATR